MKVVSRMVPELIAVTKRRTPHGAYARAMLRDAPPKNSGPQRGRVGEGEEGRAKRGTGRCSPTDLDENQTRESPLKESGRAFGATRPARKLRWKNVDKRRTLLADQVESDRGFVEPAQGIERTEGGSSSRSLRAGSDPSPTESIDAPPREVKDISTTTLQRDTEAGAEGAWNWGESGPPRGNLADCTTPSIFELGLVTNRNGPTIAQLAPLGSNLNQWACGFCLGLATGQFRGPHHPRSSVSHHHYTPNSNTIKLTQDDELLHDATHLKEDIGSMADQLDFSEMTEQEIEFHYFQIHDFDNNTKLDGLEIFHALQHTMHENDEEEIQKLDEDWIVVLIDKVLEEDDLNNDGYLEYVEYVLGRQRDHITQEKRNKLRIET
ncbi:Multiple coagulation factor deficiency protein 2 like protein [Cyphomyrmex costatus]|uniref:Multiple coagulation factor deficiency protein 2 like protein n=1 Tax=Cyphomyrmex costatus TaxID=456900 RepID=A0A195CUF9_9HYME|nr:Multiple coagulation factor deficiency protein 2 like protein [Cyphomyrmex costatus]